MPPTEYHTSNTVLYNVALLHTTYCNSDIWDVAALCTGVANATALYTGVANATALYTGVANATVY